MKLLICTSVVKVKGVLWQGIDGETQYTLTPEYVEQLKELGPITVETVHQFIRSRWGDFAEITYINASIEDGPDTVNVESEEVQ